MTEKKKRKEIFQENSRMLELKIVFIFLKKPKAKERLRK